MTLTVSGEGIIQQSQANIMSTIMYVLTSGECIPVE